MIWQVIPIALLVGFVGLWLAAPIGYLHERYSKRIREDERQRVYERMADIRREHGQE